MDNKTPDDIQKQVEQLQEWANSQPHIPKALGDGLVLKFLHSCYYNVDKAKVAADLFFSIRSVSSDLLTNRDPLSPQMQKTLEIVKLAHYEIANKKNIWIWQLNDPGLDRYDYVQDAKLFLLSTDCWLLGDDQLSESDIIIMDVKDITLKFITKFNVSVGRRLSKYQDGAMPVRLKQIHVVNAPPFIDKVFSLMKPFLKQEVTNLVRFHAPNSETLYEYVDKEDLPEDYGGTRDKMDVYMKKSVENIMKNRDLLLNDLLWRVDKKPKEKTEISTEIGSFRSLAID